MFQITTPQVKLFHFVISSSNKRLNLSNLIESQVNCDIIRSLLVEEHNTAKTHYRMSNVCNHKFNNEIFLQKIVSLFIDHVVNNIDPHLTAHHGHQRVFL